MRSSYMKPALVALLALAVLLGAAASASAVRYTVSKPVLSAKPKMDVTFRVSGSTTPSAKSGVKVVVKILLLMRSSNGSYPPMHAPYTAKVTRRSGTGGYGYSTSISIPMTGKHAVKAVRYDNGKQVGASAITYFTVTGS